MDAYLTLCLCDEKIHRDDYQSRQLFNLIWPVKKDHWNPYINPILSLKISYCARKLYFKV